MSSPYSFPTPQRDPFERYSQPLGIPVPQPLFSMPVPQFLAPSGHYESIQPQYPPPTEPFAPAPMEPMSPTTPTRYPSRAPTPRHPETVVKASSGSVWQPARNYLGVAISDPAGPTAARHDYNPWQDYYAVQRAIIDGAVDVKYLIDVLLRLDVSKMETLRDFYKSHSKNISLTQAIDSVCTGNLRHVLHGLTLGPMWYDVDLAHKALTSFRKDESLLVELILGRPEQEIRLLKTAYKRVRGTQLIDDVKKHISSSEPQRMFIMALNFVQPTNSLHDKSDYSVISKDADALNVAAEKKHDTPFFEILINRPAHHVTAVIAAYGTRYKNLSKVVKSRFKGTVRHGLLYILHGVKPKRDRQGIWRDAKLLEQSMAGMGTKDHRLIYRLIRAHWNPQRMEAVKDAYYRGYGKDLQKRVEGETSGSYRDALIAIVKSSSPC